MKKVLGWLELVGGIAIILISLMYNPGISISGSAIDKINYAVSMLTFAFYITGIVFILQGISTLRQK